ncbi:D-threo-aldose 1-dehydrogenase [Paenibacillus konkukensis]|uniref:D-threo-aldose 1-dehydrogenase n=1 Tax=Paenibacillus konkukensis TaxID=2020716 RepID=A0ABY4RYK9_9BACL|nr:aldo/keto reductase [Paenibacillus konkukensis]UQZ86474.1 D-threo-aldose 1-dehydrogenase [Paenibacillus konkukensis]
MKYRQLGKTGLQVSALSFGASSLGGVFRDIDEKEGIRAVHEAVERGINLIDVSPYYGLTKAETVLGQAISELDRSRFYLSTKAGRYGSEEFDFSPGRIIRSVDESLQRLQTDYIDILYLHDIEFGSMKQILEESIPALQRLKEQGKIRFTGVSGLPLAIFRTVLNAAEVDSMLSYCHYSLNDTSLTELLPLIAANGTGLVNASPLSMGLLSGKEPPSWHPAGEETKRVCRQAAEACAARGINLPKLAIQFATANEAIPTTLVSTARPQAIAMNADWADEPIDREELAQVLELLKPIHNHTWPSGRPENSM